MKAMPVKTIPKNATKRIAEIRASGLRMMVYSLSNNFVGVEAVNEAYAWQQVEDGDGKLRLMSDGSYVIHVHSNLWYELRVRT